MDERNEFAASVGATGRTESDDSFRDEALDLLTKAIASNRIIVLGLSGMESGMYDQYDKKLAEMKAYLIDKLDEFLTAKGMNGVGCRCATGADEV